MTFSVDVSRRDVANASRLMIPKWLALYFLLLALGILGPRLIAIVSALHSGSTLAEAVAANASMFVGLLVIGVIFCVALVVGPWFAGKRAIVRPVTWTITDEGVHLTSEVASSEIKWPAFIKYRENGQIILLYVQKKQAQFIPKRVLDETQLCELRNLISRHVKKA